MVMMMMMMTNEARRAFALAWERVQVGHIGKTRAPSREERRGRRSPSSSRALDEASASSLLLTFVAQFPNQISPVLSVIVTPAFDDFCLETGVINGQRA